MATQTSQVLAEIDDHSALMSIIREAVGVLADRWRDRLSEADKDELDLILDCADLAQKKHLIIRRLASWHYQDTLKV